MAVSNPKSTLASLRAVTGQGQGRPEDHVQVAFPVRSCAVVLSLLVVQATEGLVDLARGWVVGDVQMARMRHVEVASLPA